MRLERFRIGEYRVLRDLEIDFDRGRGDASLPNPQQDYALDFLAGVNGTGKSTVLQLLAKLFTTLDSEDYYFPIPLELTYTLSDEGGNEGTTRVCVGNMHGDAEGEEGSPDLVLRYRIKDGDWQQGKMRPEYLPQSVVVYTTGDETEWARIVASSGRQSGAGEAREQPQPGSNQDSQELPGHRRDVDVDDEFESPRSDQRILLVREERLPLVALCGLLASNWPGESARPDTLTSVLESVGLQSMVGFSLRIRSHRSLTPPWQMETIQRLASAADRTVRQGADRLFIFDMTQGAIRPITNVAKPSIYSISDTPIQLFCRLNALYEHRAHYDAPLQEVNLFLRRRADEHPDAFPGHQSQEDPLSMLHLFDWLSDGERSFLGRMALFALFRAHNLLILLDEPEVHFNDVWKREIVNMLDQIMSGSRSHALITTHSSIALSDVRPQDLLILRRQGQFTEGDKATQPPGIQTFGADPSDILVHVFGTRSASGERSLRFIKKQIGLSNTREDLEKLAKIVAPGYWRYRIQLESRRFQEVVT